MVSVILGFMLSAFIRQRTLMKAENMKPRVSDTSMSYIYIYIYKSKYG